MWRQEEYYAPPTYQTPPQHSIYPKEYFTMPAPNPPPYDPAATSEYLEEPRSIPQQQNYQQNYSHNSSNRPLFAEPQTNWAPDPIHYRQEQTNVNQWRQQDMTREQQSYHPLLPPTVEQQDMWGQPEPTTTTGIKDTPVQPRNSEAQESQKDKERITQLESIITKFMRHQDRMMQINQELEIKNALGQYQHKQDHQEKGEMTTSTKAI